MTAEKIPKPFIWSNSCLRVRFRQTVEVAVVSLWLGFCSTNKTKYPFLIVSGDGGWAGENTQWSWTQENSGQLQFLYQPHEAVREETQTLHQQIQVCAFVSFSFPPAWASLCVSVCFCVCVRKKGYVYVIWCNPDVSWVGCVVLGCAPCVRAKECDCSQRSVILSAVFSSDRWQVLLPIAQSFFFFSPCRPYFELKAKYYLQLEVCMLTGF